MGLFDKIKVNINLGTPNVNGNDSHRPHNPHDKMAHGARGHEQRNAGRSDEYFAVIEQSGLFFSGELIGIKWGKASLCRTYDELVNELTKKLNEEIEKAVKWNEPLPVRISYNEIAAKYPGKKIIGIRPTVRY